MESSLVIKVKYGDTLRRFSANVDGNNRLDLDMVRLRAKICSIFNFAADANLILRYVDEDGDLVTLVDDDDLRELMRQHLKFLRIDVHIRNDSDNKSNAGQSGSATPSRSHPIPNPFLDANVNTEVLNSMPEPLREALSNLSLPKAATSTPLVVGLADLISKIGQSVINSHFQPHVAAGTSSRNGEEFVTSEARSARVDSASNAGAHARPIGSDGPSRSPSLDSLSSGNDVKADVPFPLLGPVLEALSNLSCSKDASSNQMLAVAADSISKIGQSIDYVLNSQCQPHAASGHSSINGAAEQPTSSEARGPQSPYVDSASNASKQVKDGNITRDVVKGVAPVDLSFRPCDPFSSQSSNVNREPVSSAVPNGKPIPSGAGGPQFPSVSPASDAKQQVKAGNITRGPVKGVASVDPNFRRYGSFLFQTTNGDGIKGKMSTDDSFAGVGEISGASSLSAANNNSSTQTTSMSSGAVTECPFSGTYTIHSGPPPLGNCSIPSFQRSHCHTEAISSMFHKGVRCDGCGVYPITGPRYKSKVKENYDLCCICFSEMGNETDYIRMNRPVSVHAPRFAFRRPTMPPQSFITGAISKHAKPKLDSRFILDVNVIDGTMMAPSTPFTKIWRMHNNGALAWPKGTQLVWIGGEKLSVFHSTELEIPEDGVPVEKELDIAVDFIAPRLPGRYISYWRMASPSGHKFGQRVWVLVQVDASLKDSFYDGSQSLNLNIPLGVGGSNVPQVIDINVKPIEDDSFLQPHVLNAPTEQSEPVNQMVDKEPRQEELEHEFRVPSYPSTRPTSVPSSSVSYPIVDFPEKAPVSYPIIDFPEKSPAITSGQQSSAVGVPSSSIGIDGNNPAEETLLKELEEMGFKQVDLNKKILRINEYDLERSVEDLCGMSEWDPMLEELQEMGFRDNEMNKRLLMKNNGSIKRVVMDLINGE